MRRLQNLFIKIAVVALAVCGSVSALCEDVAGKPGNGENARKREARRCLEKGEAYIASGDYNKAMEEFINGLKISETCGCGDGGLNVRMALYKNMGNIYWAFGDYERAIGLYKTGYDLREEFPDRKTECDILVNLTGAYCFIDSVRQARKCHELALRLVSGDDPVKNFMADYDEGLILINEGDTDKALEKYRSALRKAPDEIYSCHAMEKIYLAYMQEGVPDSVIRYLSRCSRLALKNGMTDMYVQTLGDLAVFYSETDPQKSALYKKMQTAVSDSVMQSGNNLREFYRLRNIQHLYELEKTDRKISELHMQQAMKDREILFQRRATFALLTALGLFAVFLWILLRQKRKIKMAYKNLFDMNRSTLVAYRSTVRQCDGYKDRISELEDKVASLSCDPSATAKDVRYAGSSLDEAGKMKIRAKIEHIMEKEKMFCDVDFSLSRLSDAVGSNQAYVSQVINESFGKSFVDFLNDYRVREACVRLLDTEHYGNYTIGAIAGEVGYKSQSTFIRQFRKNTGLSPSVYQKMALRNREELPGLNDEESA